MNPGAGLEPARAEPADGGAGLADATIRAIGRIVLGKDGVVRLVLSVVLAGGHILLEDVPGVGKTTLAHAVARALGLSFSRIQFTADLLPADILGVSIYEPRASAFTFHPGPIFTNVLLADEINRATPKTQSALLEAMEERQVTQDRVTHALPEPFVVLATQNPAHQAGTFPLPESQLDRFMMRVAVGYPSASAERDLLRGETRRRLIEDLEPVLDASELGAMQRAAQAVRLSDPLLDYVQALLRHSRESADLATGLSPRAGLALVATARAWAFLDGRDFVIPEDVQAVLVAVTGHRLQPTGAPPGSHPSAAEEAAERLLRAVPIP